MIHHYMINIRVRGNGCRGFYHNMPSLNRASIASQRELVSDFFCTQCQKEMVLLTMHPKHAASFAQRASQCQEPGWGYEVTAETLPALSKIGVETGPERVFQL
ncbi:uncharacterized protein LOC141670977 [Apium graveolens]|uniref:uncharacterized protein LOC141670977 n=1 Tax=Apium graveolens TaxID=4045 RepID=UPI003D7BB27A